MRSQGVKRLRMTIAGAWMALALAGLVRAQAAETPAPTRPAAESSNLEAALRVASQQGQAFANRAKAWYRQTPPADRMTWSALAACAVLSGSVLLERFWRLRKSRVLPARFVARWADRLEDGPFETEKAIDLCELNPSPASRVVLAGLRRWGRPVVDLERAVSLARQVEGDRLRRNIASLRRVAALAPLIGLLGSLLAAGRALEALAPGAAWGPAVAEALAPLTAGVALAILSLFAYDSLLARVEKLTGELDRLGAETIDALAMAAPVVPVRPVPPAPHVAPEPAPAPRPSTQRAPHFRHMGVPTRPRHTVRIEIPDDL